MVVPAGHHLWIGLVGDVEDHQPAIDIAEIGAIRPLRIDIGIVRAKPGVGTFGMTHRRRYIVALAGAGEPPAPDFDRLGRVLDVDDPVELVVARMRRFEVGRARAHVDVFAIGEPQLVDAARIRPRAVEKRDRARVFGGRDVEQLEAGGLLALLLCLIGDGEDVADGLQRVRAHMRLWQIGASDDFGSTRVADVDTGEILGRAFVRQP